MAPFDTTALVSHLRNRFGDDLRMVGYVDERAAPEALYVRDDLESRVTDERLRALVDEFMMGSMESDRVLHELGYGPRNATIHDFENVQIVFVNINELEGVGFGVDGNVFQGGDGLVDEILSVTSPQRE